MKRFLVLCIAVIACYAAVTGTIAYFTDSVETANVVASGNLHVVQHEYERKDGAIKTFSQEKPLYPAVGTASKNAPFTVSGHEVMLENSIRNYVDKIVTAENKGSLNMFVRTYIAVPSFLKGVATEPWITLDVNTQQYDNNSWSELGDAFLDHVNIDDHYYDIYMTTYSGVVAPNGTTPPSLLGFYMDSHVTNNGDGLIFKQGETTYNLGNGSNMKILVASVASQAAVFANVEEAMTNTYPTGYHPWDGTFFVATQEQLDSALKTAETKYNVIISLSAKAEPYVLPSTLPAGLRITGAGADVKLTIKDNNTALSATDVEFDHVTFNTAFTFKGWGSFEEVTFTAGTQINATHDTVLVDCVNAPAAGDKVTVVTSLPTPAPTPVSGT